MLSRILAACILVLAGVAVLEGGPPRIAIVGLHQKGTLEPVTITVFVNVPPAPENRGYFVIAEPRGRGASHSTFRQLEGATSEGPFQPVVMKLSGAVYDVGAVLVGESGRVLARTELRMVRVQCRACNDSDDESD